MYTFHVTDTYKRFEDNRQCVSVETLFEVVDEVQKCGYPLWQLHLVLTF